MVRVRIELAQKPTGKRPGFYTGSSLEVVRNKFISIQIKILFIRHLTLLMLLEQEWERLDAGQIIQVF